MKKLRTAAVLLVATLTSLSLTVPPSHGSDPQPGASVSPTEGSVGAFGTCTISGTRKADILRGTPGPDYICGKGGNDTIYGRGGSDIVEGGKGKDMIYGGDGEDYLLGDEGADRVDGQGGADPFVVGGPGPDVLLGGPGDEYCIDGQDGVGHDTLKGGAGIDSGLVDLGDSVSSVELEATCIL